MFKNLFLGCIAALAIAFASLPSPARSAKIAISDLSGKIIEWDTTTNTATTLVENQGQVFDCAYAADGSLYFTAFDKNSVFKRTPDGKVSVFATAEKPTAVAVHPINGKIYFATYGKGSYGTGKIYEATPEGQVSLYVDKVSAPMDIAISDDGTLYVTNYGAGPPPGQQNPGVIKIAPDKTVTTHMTMGSVFLPAGLAAMGPNLYVSASQQARIYKKSEGLPQSIWLAGGKLLAEVHGIGFTDGKLFSLSMDNGTLVETTFTLGPNGSLVPATTTEVFKGLKYPSGMAIRP